jgi:uncharacterized protein (TIGR00255 family)
MIESMTGYGYGQASNDNFLVTAELKAVNHRYTEVSFKLPAHYVQQEILLKNRLQQRLRRGKLFLAVTVEHLHPDAEVGRSPLDIELIKHYYRELKQASEMLRMNQSGEPREIALSELLGLPNVVREDAAEVSDEEWQLVQQAVEDAMAQLEANRRSEGERLLPDLQGFADTLAQKLEEIEPYEQERLEHLKQRMENGLQELGRNVSVDQERYQQELLYYLEKYDISEEKARLRSHLSQFRDTLAAPESNGRKLLFLTQELWREVNTLSNKAYHVEIQSRAVAMKESIEKMKEQLNNIV